MKKLFVYPSGGVDTEKFKKIDKKDAKQAILSKEKIYWLYW